MNSCYDIQATIITSKLVRNSTNMYSSMLSRFCYTYTSNLLVQSYSIICGFRAYWSSGLNTADNWGPRIIKVAKNFSILLYEKFIHLHLYQWLENSANISIGSQSTLYQALVLCHRISNGGPNLALTRALFFARARKHLVRCSPNLKGQSWVISDMSVISRIN